MLFVKAKLQCRVCKIGIIKKQMLYKTKANAFCLVRAYIIYVLKDKQHLQIQNRFI